MAHPDHTLMVIALRKYQLAPCVHPIEKFRTVELFETA
jgi:hypothetical protein